MYPVRGAYEMSGRSERLDEAHEEWSTFATVLSSIDVVMLVCCGSKEAEQLRVARVSNRVVTEDLQWKTEIGV